MIPAADTLELGRGLSRARHVRGGLTVAIAVLLGAAILVGARSRESVAAAARPGPTSEIVLDVSGSVGNVSYLHTRRVLGRFARSRGNVGLILFSDTAQETLPPGSPPRELLPFAEAFRRDSVPVSTAPGTGPPPEPNPWYPSFSSGTRISSGLAAAGAALRRDHVRGTVVLVSDLGDDPNDVSSVRSQLLALARQGVDVRIVALPNALESDRRLIERFLGPGHFGSAPPLQPAPQRKRHGFPIWLAVVTGFLAVVLAANELFARSLAWEPA